MKHLRPILISFFLLFSYSLIGQVNFSSTIPASTDPLDVCGDSALFTVTLTCAGPQAANNGTLTITLPQGIEVSGTTTFVRSTGATGSLTNTGTNQVPVYAIPSLSVGQNIVISYSCKATCGRINEPVNVNYFSFTHSQGTQTANTTGYNVRYAALSIVDITNKSYVNATAGTSFTRKLRILNGGFGRVRQIKLSELNSHNGIMITGISGGNTIASPALPTNDPVFTVRSFTAARIIGSNALGNGDNWLDNNEYIDITETVLLPQQGCGGGTSNTDYSAFYGCFSDNQCPVTNSTDISDTEIADIEWKGSWGPANLTYRTTHTNYASCGFTDTYTIWVRNWGTIPATDVYMEVMKPYDATEQRTYLSTVQKNNVNIAYTVLSTVNTDCFTSVPANAGGKLGFNVGTIPPNDSVKITVVRTICSNTEYCASAVGHSWQYGLQVFSRYSNGCGDLPEYYNGWTSWEEQAFGVYAGISNVIPTDYVVSDGGKFKSNLGQLQVYYPQFAADGFIEFVYTLPQGITYTTGDPIKIKNSWEYHDPSAGWSATSINYNSTTRVLTARFNVSTLPVGSEYLNPNNYSSYLDVTLTGVAGVNCGATWMTINKAIYATVSAACPAKKFKLYCGDWYIDQKYCTPSPVCNGGNTRKYSISRNSFGFPDNDDDEIPDASGSVNMTYVNQRFALPGDTIKSYYSAYIHNNNGTTTWQYGYAIFDIKQSSEIDPIHVSASARVWDASANSYINIPSITPTSFVSPSDGNATQFFYDLKPFLPVGFNFQTGDSIVVMPKWKITKAQWDNVRYLVGAQGFVSNNVHTSYNWWGTTPSQQGCGYKFDYFFVTKPGADLWISKNEAPSGCATDGKIWTQANWWLSPHASAFPKEARIQAVPETYNLTLPQGATVTSATIEFLEPWNYVGITRTLTPTVSAPGFASFDLKSLFTAYGGTVPMLSIDQYLRYEIRVSYNGACGSGTVSGLPIELTYKGLGAYGTVYPTGTLAKTYDVYMSNSTPNFSTGYSNFNSSPVGDTATWDIMTYGGDNYQNVWMAEKPEINGIDIVQIKGRNGTPDPVFVNGKWQMGNYSIYNSYYYTVKAVFSSCAKDSMKLMISQGCTGYPTANQINNPALLCTYNTGTFYVNPKQTQLQQIITQQPAAAINMCDAMTYTIAVVSAQEGKVTDIKTEFEITPGIGVNIIAGTSQVEYPSNSGNWYTIPNPTFNAGRYTWDISNAPALLALFGNNGLPGVLSAPNNGFKLRFNAQSTPCEFKSGITFLFTTYGKKACGTTIFATDQITNPVNVNGAPASNRTYLVSIRKTDPQVCNNLTGQVTFKAINQGAGASSSTSEFIDFIIYSGGSLSGNIIPVRNTPAGAPTIINSNGGTVYRFTMTNGVAVGDSIVFRANVLIDPNLPCHINQVRVDGNTNVSFTTTCTSNGQVCSISKITGQPDLSTQPIRLNVNRSSLIISNLTAVSTLNPPTGEIVNGVVTLQNNGTIPITTAQPVTVLYYQDQDYNQAITASDVYLGSQVVSANIAVGATYNANFTLPITGGNISPFMAAISSTPCYCSTSALTLPTVAISPDTITLTVCPGLTTSPLGSAPISGYSYTWVPITPGGAAYLSALNVANPTFMKLTNSTGAVQTFVYQLYINRGSGAAGVQTFIINVDYSGSASCPANKGSIGNYVWKDFDADGLQNEGLVHGINNVSVQLWTPGPDNAIGGADDTLRRTVVTVNNPSGYPGFYLFDNLDAGYYYVKFPTSGLGTLSTFSAATNIDGNSDANTSTGNSGLIFLNPALTGISRDNMTIDAGYIPAFSSISNYVWNDADRDGIQDANEAGISGVTVNLFDNVGNFVASVITDATGNYKFDKLYDTQYRVQFVLPVDYTYAPKAQGGDANFDSDVNVSGANMGFTDIITLVPGVGRTDIDAGMYFSRKTTATLGNYVWYDANNDGIQGVTERGAANVFVSLYDNANTLLGTTATNGLGFYQFTDLNPGTYKVGFALPAGYTFTTLNQGTDELDSDVATSGVDFGKTPTVTLAAGDENFTLDAGIIQTAASQASVGDFVWIDANLNGLQDANEPGMSGILVSLYDESDNLIRTTVTNDLGYYMFTNLTAGAYYITFSMNSDYMMTTRNNGKDDVDSDADDTGTTDIFSLKAGEINTDIDAGVILLTTTGQASIGDFVWYDLNKNGIQEGSEPGAAGVTVTLFDNTNTMLRRTVTDIEGGYNFVNLMPGTYYVVFSNLPAGYIFTQSGQGTVATGSDADAAGKTANITLTSGQNYLDADAGIIIGTGNSGLAGLGNFVWYDMDNDNLQDANEPGVSNVSVSLLASDGTTVLATTKTGNDGYYIFNNLAAGTYYVAFSGLPSGYAWVTPFVGTDKKIDSDANPTTGRSQAITLISGQTDLSIDAGVYKTSGTTGSIGDYVWIDANGNGVQDVLTEKGIRGIMVVLKDDLGNQIATTVTDANGFYLFVNVAAGTYTVGFQNLPTGFSFSPKDAGGNDNVDSDVTPSTGFTGNITLTAGQNRTDVDAGLVSTTAAIGNYVWMDTDADGVQESGEVGVAGVTVTLYNTSNLPVGTAVTDENGFYYFMNVAPATYTLGFSTLPANTAFTTQDAGGNNNTDSDVNPLTNRTDAIVVTAGMIDYSFDAGLVTPRLASLEGYVWGDVNKDGLQSVDEEPVAGVTVTLYSGATVVAITVTDATGVYRFDNIPAGTYSIGFTTLPVSTKLTTQNVGSDDTIDSDPNPTTGLSGTYTVAAGQHIEAADAGIVYPWVNVGDFVWLDINENGIQDPTERGVSEITVSLYTQAGSIYATTTTDAYGHYLFRRVPVGYYYVVFSLPVDYKFTTKGTLNTADDSDPDRVTGKTDNFYLPETNDRLDLDAGVYYVKPTRASIESVVWFDKIQNGIQEASEGGVSNLTVTLYDNTMKPISTTLTDGFGKYHFNNLPAGDYYVGVTLRSGFMFTNQDATSDEWDSDIATSGTNFGKSSMITLSEGEVYTLVDAGIIPIADSMASVGDKVWYDLNNNNLKELDEQGVAGVIVTLKDKNNATVQTTKTDAFGIYNFTNVPVGEYYIQFSGYPAGMSFITRDAGADEDVDSDADATGRTDLFYLDAGDYITNVDAGLYNPTGGTGKIGNKVWTDFNGDGVQNGAEYGTGGVTVKLWDAAATTVLAMNVTNPDGIYWFTGLDAGNYRVSFENLPVGYKYSFMDQGAVDSADSDANPADGISDVITLTTGGSIATIDAGISNLSKDGGKASLGSVVWIDLNQNGIQDQNEPGLDDVTVTLKNLVTNTTKVLKTDRMGRYIFNELDPGRYEVVVSGLPSGYAFTTQNTGTNDFLDSDVNMLGSTGAINLRVGESNVSLGAGVSRVTPKASLGNYVWYDLDQDGLQDATERGVMGVTVNLLNSAGVIIDRTVTNRYGYYLFSDLNPGVYSVTFANLPEGFQFTAANRGTNETIDSDAIPSADGFTGSARGFRITGTNSRNDVRAGIFSTTRAAIGDYVWNDDDRDGIQDGNETGTPGVTVTLYDDTNTVVASAITDDRGQYLFPNLLAGNYYVGFGTLPIDSYITDANQGADDALDSDADVATALNPMVSLAPGDVDLTQDAGIVGPEPGRLFGYVWYDFRSGVLPTNANGIQNTGERAVAGLNVSLYDNAGNFVATTVTGADGIYHFDNLAPGTYEVRFNNVPRGTRFTSQNMGADDTKDSDADPLTGIAGTYTVNYGEYLEAADAGFIPPASLTGMAFFDGIVNTPNSANGFRDVVTETGIGGVRVVLTDDAGAIIARATTNDLGVYVFRNLRTDLDYRVGFEANPSGCALCEFTLGNVNDALNDTTDSDVDPLNQVISGASTYARTSLVTNLLPNEMRRYIDGGYARAGAVFPVELLDFTATLIEADGLLRWVTSSEINSAHFDIERSLDGGASFEWIGQKTAAGNSNDAISYSYRDKNVVKIAQDKIHYRLKMVDIDNTYKYSNVVELKLSTSTIFANVYPNPTKDFLNLEYQLYGTETATLNITNALGQLIYTSVVENNESDLNNIELDLRDWSSGTYFIQLSTDSKSITRKFIKE